MVNWVRCGRKRSWPTRRHRGGICVEALAKNRECFVKVVYFAGGNRTAVCPWCKSEALPIEQTCFLRLRQQLNAWRSAGWLWWRVCKCVLLLLKLPIVFNGSCKVGLQLGETVKMWNCVTVKLWNYETVKLWNCETMKLWNYETVKLWNCVTVKLWNCETVKL